MAAHTAVAGMQNVDQDVVEALRTGKPMGDPKLEALRTFVRQVVENRAQVDQASVDAFLAAGYSRQNLLEVILGIGMKTLSNYTDILAEIPLDDAFQPMAWTPPQE